MTNTFDSEVLIRHENLNLDQESEAVHSRHQIVQHHRVFSCDEYFSQASFDKLTCVFTFELARKDHDVTLLPMYRKVCSCGDIRNLQTVIIGILGP